MNLFARLGSFGIAQKTNFLITVILLLLATFLGLYFSRQQTRILTTSVEERIEVLLNSMAFSLEYPMLIDDRRSIARIVKGMLAQKDLMDCSIFNSRGRVIYRARRPQVSGELREFSAPVWARRSAATNEDLFFRRENRGRMENIGRIQVQVSMQALNERTAEVKRTVALVVVAVIMLASGAGYLLLVFVLDRPVAALVEATRRISQGNLEYRVPVQSHDEIGQLARSFDRMVSDLQRTMVSKEYVDKIIDTMIDALIVLDLAGRIERVNRAAETLLGCPETELKGALLGRFLEGEDPFFSAEGLSSLSARKYYQNLEKVMVARSGQRIPVLFSAAIMHGQNGAPQAVVCMALDITERKEAERKLETVVKELKRSNTELEQFAYVASHDLQEPLRTISSYLQLLKRRYQGKLDSNADEFIGFAVEGSKRMQQLINDLLLYSRVQTRGNPFNLTDCEAVIKKALANLQLAVLEGQARITHDPLPDVLGDEIQLVQLFQNLIGNAIKYHGPASPAVHVWSRRVDNRVLPVTGPGESWQFSIRDNGIGIAAEHYDRIFQIFRRLHTRDEYPGTGIGLAVCKKIVERHGGQIWVDSIVGQGSTFHFTIPVRPEESLGAPSA